MAKSSDRSLNKSETSKGRDEKQSAWTGLADRPCGTCKKGKKQEHFKIFGLNNRVGGDTIYLIGDMCHSIKT